jgi:hypothetical protein
MGFKKTGSGEVIHMETPDQSLEKTARKEWTDSDEKDLEEESRDR